MGPSAAWFYEGQFHVYRNWKLVAIVGGAAKRKCCAVLYVYALSFVVWSVLSPGLRPLSVVNCRLSACWAQAMFASFIPEITDILGSRTKYGGAFKKEHGKR